MLRRALVLSAVLAAAASAAAGAHTAVRSADPGPGETVSGVVDRVVLEFLDPIASPPEVEVRAPDGELVTGLEPTTLTGDDRVAERRFDALDEAGRYRVDYVYVALDGAEQRGAHEFRYEPGADRVRPWGAVPVGIGALGALAAVVLVARRTGRAVGGDDHRGGPGGIRARTSRLGQTAGTSPSSEEDE